MDLFVDKNTDLMRSSFTAIGLMELLYYIPPEGSGQEVIIVDMGGCYRVSSSLSADELTAFVRQTGYLKPLLPAIQKPHTGKEKKLIEEGTSIEEINLAYIPRNFDHKGGRSIDYGEEKSRVDEAKKLKRQKNEVRVEGATYEPDPNFPLWAHLCSYFGKGSAMRGGYQLPLHAWHAHQGEMAEKLWDLIRHCYGQFPNALSEARTIWDKEFRKQIEYPDYALSTDVSSLAVVSPSTSKGTSDASGYNLLSENTPNTFWLELYFSFAGYMASAMPYTIGSDVVTYYPIPKEITRDALRDVMSHFRDANNAYSLYSNSFQLNRAKLDILNTILFYKSLVNHFLVHMDDGSLPEGIEFPLDLIEGITGYYYKDISTQIPFDETTFILPEWVSTKERSRLEEIPALLDAHFTLVSAIRGRPPQYKWTADELSLLESYRRYTTHGEAMDWIRFCIAYGFYRFRISSDVPRFPSIGLSVLKESLPMNDKKDFRPILENAGFDSIAQAINSCTAYARYKKDIQNDKSYPFKVRYGLGDDLLRNAHDPARFITDLSSFVHDYQRETINVGQNRPGIEPQDLHAVTELVAEYGSSVVAHLLVAAGYASRYGSSN